MKRRTGQLSDIKTIIENNNESMKPDPYYPSSKDEKRKKKPHTHSLTEYNPLNVRFST